MGWKKIVKTRSTLQEEIGGVLKRSKGVYETVEKPVPERLMENVQMQGF
jgi:hypothetical protein